MAYACSLTENASDIARTRAALPGIGRTQRTLIEVVRAVRNVHDERDVQCLVFLAGEFGFLRPNPFCFSRKASKDMPAPCSMILRQMLADLLDDGLLEWRGGTLRVAAATALPAAEPALRLGWLADLSSAQRQALTQAALDPQRLDGARGRGVAVLLGHAQAGGLDSAGEAPASVPLLATLRQLSSV